jgi:hypothetical protein
MSRKGRHTVWCQNCSQRLTEIGPGESCPVCGWIHPAPPQKPRLRDLALEQAADRLIHTSVEDARGSLHHHCEKDMPVVTLALRKIDGMSSHTVRRAMFQAWLKRNANAQNNQKEGSK